MSQISRFFFVLLSMFVNKQLRSFLSLFFVPQSQCDMKQSQQMSNFHRSSDSLIAKMLFLSYALFFCLLCVNFEDCFLSLFCICVHALIIADKLP